MKKNITINLFGTLYAIDEDAYNMLERYLDSMKNYFTNNADGAEIADDIEHRVAELLWAKKQQGLEAVDVAVVREIITKIGNPQDIDAGREETSAMVDDIEYEEVKNEEAQAQEQSANASKAEEVITNIKGRIAGKRLYRNKKDKKIGGVCAGLAEFFGTGDPLWWRVGFVAVSLFCFELFHQYNGPLFTFAPEWLYLLLLIIVPEAKSPEDLLRQRGQNITPETIKEQVISETEPEKTAPTTTTNAFGGCIRALVFMIMFACLLPLFGITSVVIVTFVGTIYSLFGSTQDITFTMGHEWLEDMINYCGVWMWPGTIAAMTALSIAIYAIIRTLFGSGNPMSTGKRMFLITIFLLAVAIFFISVVFGAVRFNEFN